MTVEITIRNKTAYPAKGMIECRDTGFHEGYSLAPMSDESVTMPHSNSMVIDASITRPDGTVQASRFGPQPLTDFLQIAETAPGQYAVLSDQPFTATAAGPRAVLERQWPAGWPSVAHISSGRLISGLRTNSATATPCVMPTVLAIGREVIPELTQADADRIAAAVVQTVIRADYAPVFLSGVHRCEDGKQLYWGLTTRFTPLTHGDDRVEFQFAVAADTSDL